MWQRYARADGRANTKYADSHTNSLNRNAAPAGSHTGSTDSHTAPASSHANFPNRYVAPADGYARSSRVGRTLEHRQLYCGGG